jgi:hypothetical protein
MNILENLKLRDVIEVSIESVGRMIITTMSLYVMLALKVSFLHGSIIIIGAGLWSLLPLIKYVSNTIIANRVKKNIMRNWKPKKK